MRIGPTVARRCIQAPSDWGEAKPCPASGTKTFEEPAALKVSSTHTSRAPRQSLRKRSPGSIST